MRNRRLSLELYASSKVFESAPWDNNATGSEDWLWPAASCIPASSSFEKGSRSWVDVRVCHSTTTTLKAETSSIVVSLLSQRASSLISLISYLALDEGVTLIAEVFVSKADLLWGDGLGKALNGCDSRSRTSGLERTLSMVELLSDSELCALNIAENTVFQELPRG